MAAEGSTSDAIAAYFTAHGTRISGQAIRLRLARTREERGAVAASVTREHLRPVVLSDLDRLDRIRRQVAKKAREVSPDLVMTREWTALKRLEADLVDKKLHYAGADDAGLEKTSDDELRELVRQAAAVLAGEDK